MDAWGRDQQVGEKVKLLADGNATFAKALGLELDATGVGLGTRSQRFAMEVEDSVVQGHHVEHPGAFEVSSAEAVLATLQRERCSQDVARGTRQPPYTWRLSDSDAGAGPGRQHDRTSVLRGAAAALTP